MATQKQCHILASDTRDEDSLLQWAVCLSHLTRSTSTPLSLSTLRDSPLLCSTLLRGADSRLWHNCQSTISWCGINPRLAITQEAYVQNTPPTVRTEALTLWGLLPSPCSSQHLWLEKTLGSKHREPGQPGSHPGTLPKAHSQKLPFLTCPAACCSCAYLRLLSLREGSNLSPEWPLSKTNRTTFLKPSSQGRWWQLHTHIPSWRIKMRTGRVACLWIILKRSNISLKI